MERLYPWRLEWCSNLYDPGSKSQDIEWAINQGAKDEAHRVYCEHGIRVRWQQVRDGVLTVRDRELPQEPEIILVEDNDWYSTW